MYTDMYNTFENECVPYNSTFNFQNNKPSYINYNKPTYEMDYEDTTILPFYIDEKYQDLEIVITLYNYRMEVVHDCTTFSDSNGYVYLTIDNVLSNKLHKGYYYIGVQAREPRLYTTNDSTFITVCTLISKKDCTLYIK